MTPDVPRRVSLGGPADQHRCADSHHAIGIQAEDPAMPLFLGEGDQCRIGKVHGSVGVLVHQLGRSLDRLGRQLGEYQAVRVDQTPQRPLTGDATGLAE